jgi:hypothetical protein
VPRRSIRRSFRVVFTQPAAIADIAYQIGRDLRHSVHRLGRHHDRHRERSQRLGARIAVLTVGVDDAPSAFPHDRPGRRYLDDGSRQVSCRLTFCLPVRVLSRLLPGIFPAQLRAAQRSSSSGSVGRSTSLLGNAVGVGSGS